ncbi:MAG: hypothetical protein GXP24_14845 [Planctomycetes bacterium]|nr:hypothetical protein [Planctomycetota bacterium]
MSVKQLKDTNIKIFPDKYNINRMTGEEAIAFRPQNFFKLKFEQVDEPIRTSSGENKLDSEEPSGELLDRMVDRFPAPPEWHDE